MARKTNLYHNLVNNEDQLTELLANLLQFRAFKDIFSGFIAEALAFPDFSFEYAHVETQKNLGRFGKPDLMIENEAFCILIECKTDDNRKPTPHQLFSYRNYLNSLTAKKCGLIFLIPYYYEYEALIERTKKVTTSKIQPKLIDWTELVGRIECSKIANQNIAIKHFVSLLHARFDVHPIIFSEEEMMMMRNKEFPTTLLRLIDLVCKVGDKFPKPFKTKELFNESGFGYIVKNQVGEDLLWFGCDYIFWKDHGCSFAIGVCDGVFDQVLIDCFKAIFRAKFGQEVKVSVGAGETCYMVPIPESLIKDPHNIKKLVRFIADAAEYCNTCKVAAR